MIIQMLHSVQYIASSMLPRSSTVDILVDLTIGAIFAVDVVERYENRK